MIHLDVRTDRQTDRRINGQSLNNAMFFFHNHGSMKIVTNIKCHKVYLPVGVRTSALKQISDEDVRAVHMDDGRIKEMFL